MAVQRIGIGFVVRKFRMVVGMITETTLDIVGISSAIIDELVSGFR